MTKNFQSGKVLSLAGSHLIHDLYTAAFVAVIPLLKDKFTLSNFEIGIMIVLLRIPSILNIFFGLMADHLNLKYFVVITPTITAIAMSLINSSDSFYLISALLLLSGFSSAIFHVTTPPLIKEYSGDKLGTGMSLFMVSGELARSLGPIIIVALISFWGLEGTWRFMFLGITISFAQLFVVNNMEYKPNGKKIDKEKLKKSWNNIKGLLYLVAGIVLSRILLLSTLSSFLTVYLTDDIGFTVEDAAYALAVLEGSGAIGALFAGTISDKIGRKKVLSISLLLSSITMLFFLYSSGWALFAILVFLGLTAFAITPVLMALLMENEHEHPAAVNGIFMTLNFATSSIVSILFGYMSDIISLHTSLLICTILAMFGFIFIAKIKER